MRQAIVCASILLAAASARADCGATFSFVDFSSAGGLNLVGDADIMDSKIRLTRAGQGGAGAAWYQASQARLDRGFTTRFTFSIRDGSADGLAFVIQSQQDDAIGNSGSGIGYQGIPSSVAIEFDTFGFGDEIPTPHISVQSRGVSGNDNGDEFSLGHTVLPFPIDTGDTHEVKIEYTPGTLYVWIDGDPRLYVPLNLGDVLGDSILGDGSCAWVGFTGGAGAATADQLIESWSFDDFSGVTTCVPVDLDGGGNADLPETGDRVDLYWNVTGTGPKTYHWRVHDGDFFEDDARHTGARSNRMIIDPWIPADNVKYDFESSNECSGLGVGSLVPGIKCPGDLNYDGIVEDSDFVLFLPAYNALIVPDADKRCDWNGDGLVDDADFVFFVKYYNDLICP